MKDLDVVMPMDNLKEYSDNYSKTSRSLNQFCRDEPKKTITDSESFINIINADKIALP